ncbi:CHY zinc finger protein [Bacillus sp. es.036]|uniref:CHY zinc finger protein n=1 Tax=Bacillus sp. es.036 TaxID=1761764 RepID=UPI000BF8436C|nr:CHY zinc finger protein [Bacillus sp. es.036]PFG03282.1 putative CHY-type Zn-finger protein [Bacillus sp. es.036]
MLQDQIIVKGKTVDNKTRCEHYHSERDIVAIKFYCCDTYYPCFLCHQETADHHVTVWPKEKYDKKAILCGNCRSELTIQEYLTAHSMCPYCHASYNEGCKLHYHLYFDENKTVK